MNRSIRTLGLAFGAAALFSGASASAALAANPITISVSGTDLVINDPTGVTQATIVKTVGSSFEVEELNSANELVEGPGVTATVYYSANRWYIDTGSVTITRVIVTGNAGGDLLSTAGVTNVPTTILGDAGGDTLVGGPTASFINGGADGDVIRGGAGNDILSGSIGSDTIKGENGDDQINDKDGYADNVDGGNDNDTFRRDATLDTATNIETYL
ncbi:MAG: hypothetical protein Q7T55_05810 [Solirubrobacteraceae bacterium]|nr:hypothetical protein [Solirubrobacteraceae bacterium]